MNKAGDRVMLFTTTEPCGEWRGIQTYMPKRSAYPDENFASASAELASRLRLTVHQGRAPP